MFLDFLQFLSVIFPLLPVAVIAIKKNYRNDPLNFLMILCVLNFTRNLLMVMPGVEVTAREVILHIFGFIEFIFLMLIFKFVVPVKNRTLVNIFFSVYLSVIITVLLLQGFGKEMPLLEILQNSIIIFAGILSVAKLGFGDNLDIFSRPLFWIAIGALFYFSIALLTQVLNNNFEYLTSDNNNGNLLLLIIGNLAMYFFFLLAAFLYDHDHGRTE